MYSCNGVDLSTREYNELKRLVDAYDRGEDVNAVAEAALGGNSGAYRIGQSMASVYSGLEDVRFVSGLQADNRFIFRGLLERGIDFVHDYQQMRRDEDERLKRQRSHDFRVALVGAVAGGVFGLVSGAFGSFALDAIVALIQTAP